jgi:bifunctional non-homologous end joining protein LigD
LANSDSRTTFEALRLTKRYPLIGEAAVRNRSTSFVIDGEAVLLGVDGISHFNGLHSRRHDDEVQPTS